MFVEKEQIGGWATTVNERSDRNIAIYADAVRVYLLVFKVHALLRPAHGSACE